MRVGWDVRFRPIADNSGNGHFAAVAQSCCSSKASEIENLARQAHQLRVLIVVLAINAIMFVLEFGAGAIAGSTALMADAADMLGDALVYGVSIYALTRSDRWKAGAAMFKGLFIRASHQVASVRFPPKADISCNPNSLAITVKY